MLQIRLGFAIVCAYPLFSAPCFADIAELPIRKAGAWEITTVAEHFGMKRFTTCITPTDPIVLGAGDKECLSPDVTKTGNDVIVNVMCKRANGTEFTSMLFAGDFSSWYRATSKMTFTFPDGRESHTGLSITARYEGDCSKANTAADTP